jgi:hypothetical protein
MIAFFFAAILLASGQSPAQTDFRWFPASPRTQTRPVTDGDRLLQAVGWRDRGRRSLQGNGLAEGTIGEHLNHATIKGRGACPNEAMRARIVMSASNSGRSATRRLGATWLRPLRLGCAWRARLDRPGRQRTTGDRPHSLYAPTMRKLNRRTYLPSARAAETYFPIDGPLPVIRRDFRVMAPTRAVPYRLCTTLRAP